MAGVGKESRKNGESREVDSSGDRERKQLREASEPWAAKQEQVEMPLQPPAEPWCRNRGA